MTCNLAIGKRKIAIPDDDCILGIYVVGIDGKEGPPMKHVFQNEAFCAALDAHRLARMMTWKQVAEESGVSASTLTRMQQGKRPDVDGLAALLKWSGLKADDFLGGQEANRPETIAQMTALLRADPKLSEAGKKAMEGVLRSAYESLRNV